MSFMVEGFLQAIELIVNLDREVFQIVLLTLKVAFAAVGISLVLGIPFGIWLVISNNRLKSFLLSLVNTGMGAPPVVVGLFVFLLLARKGPFGNLEILFTPTAMIAAEVLLGLPVVAGLTYAAISQVPAEISLQALGLGATRLQAVLILAREARLMTLAAVMAAFGAVISEVGAVMMVGGNIKGHTRTLTTAIVAETRMGKFDMAIALGVILFIITLITNVFLTSMQKKGGEQNWLGRTWR